MATFLYFFLFQKKLLVSGKIINNSNNIFLENSKYIVNGQRDVKINNYMEKILISTYKEIDTIKEKTLFQTVVSILPKYFLELIIFLSLLGILLFANRAENVNELLPLITLFGVALIRLIPSISLILSSRSRIISHTDAVQKFFNFLDQNITLEKETKQILSPQFSQHFSIRFDQVSFSYIKGSKLLKDISFEVHAGELFGIVGDSGKGKSTLIDIMTGLLTPNTGKVFLNDLDLKNINRRDLNEIFSYLPQKSIIFDGSILDNICPYENSDEIDFSKVFEAMNLAKLPKEFQNERSLNQYIGSDGEFLSGGQRQRLTLARAFYARKPILILDEPTSSLDNANEVKIFSELKKIAETRKIIVVVVTHSKLISQFTNKFIRL